MPRDVNLLDFVKIGNVWINFIFFGDLVSIFCFGWMPENVKIVYFRMFRVCEKGGFTCFTTFQLLMFGNAIHLGLFVIFWWNADWFDVRLLNEMWFIVHWRSNSIDFLWLSYSAVIFRYTFIYFFSKIFSFNFSSIICKISIVN